jgi:tetratricopeptide (TPR) repeat protein
MRRPSNLETSRCAGPRGEKGSTLAERTRWLLGSALLLSLAAVGCSVFERRPRPVDSLPADDRAKLELARRFVAERREEEASRVLLELRDRHPSNPRIHHEYQDIRIKQGEGDSVREEYRVLAGAKGDVLSLLLHARLLEDRRERRALIELAIERDPSFHWAHFARGVELAHEGKHAEARQEFQRAAQLGKPFPEAWLRGSEASLHLGDYSSAIDHLRRYLELEPLDTAARFNLASALARVGRHEESQVQFAMVLEIEPRDREARSGLAGSLLRQGKVDEALSEYEEVARLSPADPDPYYNLGVLYEDYKGDLPRAVAAYRRYLQLGGKDSLRVRRFLQRLTGEKP